MEVVLTLDDDPERTVTIPFSKTNEDGASDSDYNGVPTERHLQRRGDRSPLSSPLSRTGSVTRARR